MGLFKTKTRHPLDGLAPRALRRGTQIPHTEVNHDIIDYARDRRPRKPRLGHEAPIALVLQGDDVVAYYDDLRVGRMKPEMVGHYRADFERLRASKQFGRTVIYIKPEGAKMPHCVALNCGAGAFDGGIL